MNRGKLHSNMKDLMITFSSLTTFFYTKDLRGNRNRNRLTFLEAKSVV